MMDDGDDDNDDDEWVMMMKIENVTIYPLAHPSIYHTFICCRLDYCVHASGGGGKGGGKVDLANGSFPVTPSLTIDVLLGYAHEYIKNTLK